MWGHEVVRTGWRRGRALPEDERKEGSIFCQDSEEGVQERAVSGLMAVSRATLEAGLPKN